MFGAMPMDGEESMLQLLIDGDAILQIRKELWLPLEEALFKLENPPLMAKFKVVGSKVLSVQLEAEVLQTEV